jgi:hypothetical protein
MPCQPHFCEKENFFAIILFPDKMPFGVKLLALKGGACWHVLANKFVGGFINPMA